MDDDLADTCPADENGIFPSQYVQIKASGQEVREWISGFADSKKLQSSLSNIEHFCCPREESQGCARVDAVFFKRKDNHSHITVRDVHNYRETVSKKRNASVLSPSPVDQYLENKDLSDNCKKPYDALAIQKKLQELQSQLQK